MTSTTNSLNVKIISDEEMLADMIALASERHRHQFDKAGNPYILHCVKVMQWLHTTDKQLMCIAMGHDLFEDTKTTASELLMRGYSDRVVDGIRCMTKMPGESYEEYQEKVISNNDSVRVKKCDLRHNSDLRRLKGIRQSDLERTIRYVTFYHRLEEISNERGLG